MHKFFALTLLAAPLVHAADLPSVSPTAETGRRAEASFPMVDPSLDDPNKPWCYFTHPTSCIGVPWMPGLNLQITPEGNLFTNFAELALFWGPENKPLASRQRQFLNGWIPIIRDSWKDGDLTYDYEVFGAILDGFDEKNTLQFVKISATNKGSAPATAKFLAGIRRHGSPRRERAGGFNPLSNHEFKDGWLWRDGTAICAYPKDIQPAKFEAALDLPYEKPFTGRSVGASARTELGIAHYDRTLAPGESLALIVKMPHFPVEAKDSAYLAAANAADYDTYRNKTIAYWEKALGNVNRIHTPGELMIENAHRATAVHVMLGTHTAAEGRTQTDGLPYPDLFTLALYDYGLLYNAYGLDEFVEANIPHCLKRQLPDGLLWDPSVSAGQQILTSHGQMMAYMCNHVLMTRKNDLGRDILPAITRAVELIRKDHETQPNGLMRASTAFDAEMIKGQYTSHNYFALTGLRSAIRLARLLGESETAAAWLKVHDSFEKSLLKAVRESAAPDGYVPTGLCGFLTGEAARGGFAEYRTDQDWENVAILWPTELVSPGDPLISGTLKRLRATKYREGIMTYRNGQHLHQYVTTRGSNQATANGDSKQALIDTYHELLHSGSANESFENMIRPWTDRDVEFCPPPHVWGCSNTHTAIRNLFILEQGGRGGLEMEKRDILLFNAVSRAWLKPGEPMGIENANTMFGKVTALMTPRSNGADISIKTDLHTQPQSLVVRIPYFAKVKSFTTDAKQSKRDGEVIRLSPDATKLSLEWTVDPAADQSTFQDILLGYRIETGFWAGKRSEAPPAPVGFLTPAERSRAAEPLSFKLVLNAWKTEYSRRFVEHVKAGGPVKRYDPLPLQPQAERQAEADKTKGEKSLTTGKPVTCSPGSTNPELANDGEIGDTDRFWQCNTPGSWWQVDLGAVKDISTVRVVPYYGRKERFYQFIVRTSTDGQNWTNYLDLSQNTKNIGVEGASYTGQPTPVRYIKVEMLKNSANEWMQLVEVHAK
jgi:hypothetical protein